MTELTREEAAAECAVLAANLGTRLARTIMGQVVEHELEPDQMEDLVVFCIGDCRRSMLEAGGDPHDVEVAAQHIYVALVKEGARLSRAMTWERGHA